MIDTNRHVRHFARYSPSLLHQNSMEVTLTKAFRMNEQPSSKMMFEGDWGCCPNEQFSKKLPKVILRKWVNLYRFALLANLWEVKISPYTISVLEKFPHLTCGRFVHEQKSSLGLFELVTDLGTSDFEKFIDQTCSRFGNKWNTRYRTSRQVGEKSPRAVIAQSHKQ